jgi:autotransporter-associated beta strand protein
MRRSFLLVLVVLMTAATAEAGLTSLYTFDEGMGTTAHNSVSGAPDGTMAGGTHDPWSGDGIGGGSFYADGNGNYVDCTTSGLPNGSAMATGTVAFWTRNWLGNGEHYIMGAWNPWRDTGDLTDFEIGTRDGRLYLYVRSSFNDGPVNLHAFDAVQNGGTDWTDNTWHHVSVSWDVTQTDAGTETLYIDGIQQALTINSNTVASTDTFGPWTNPVHIGGIGGTTNDDYAGRLDDVAVWSNQLTTGQARSLYPLGGQLRYGVQEAEALFAIDHPGGSGVVKGTAWSYVTGLSGNPGDLTNIGGVYTLQLDANSGVQGVPVPLQWSGIGDTTWSTVAGLNNWKDSGGAAADYANGVSVTFDDTATGTSVDISAADVLPASVTFNNSSQSFTITGIKGIAGTTGVLKQGTGTVTLNSVNTYTGVTTVQAGTLQMSESAYTNVATNGGADIQGGKGVLDYSAGGVSPAPEVQALLTASYHGGVWDVGQIRNTTAATTGLSLGWKEDTAVSQVTIMATYVGDADLSGTVNVADLTALLNDYNKTGMVWKDGDFNYDSVVNVADLTALLNNYNRSILGSVAAGTGLSIGSSAVPEPRMLALLVPGLLGLLAYGWRKRRSIDD